MKTKQHLIKELLNLKDSKDILKGDWARREILRKDKINSLKVAQSNLIDKCIEDNDWSSWNKIEDTIKQLKKQIESDFLFEMVIFDLSSKQKIS